ncbi:tyrosine-type recombinase/integrase [Deinococcus aestuarii]|uniref:tyrosine-type recombinase/integrase n=1 Tax=Deinococcus aestuarii TaxID=2774531 RepID=UPI001C0BFD29
MDAPRSDRNPTEVRGQIGEANFPLHEIARETARLWRRHHLDYDQTKHVVEQARRSLGLQAPRERRRTVDRLDRHEVERLIEHAYRHSAPYGLMVKTLFYTGARVSEFVNLRVEDLHLALDPPQVYIAHAKGGSDGYVPILPGLAQELRTHLAGRTRGYLFESNRQDKYTPRAVQRLVKTAAGRAGIEKQVTPHRLRASVATILLDAGMPLDQVQKFLRHKRITTTQIYAQTSLRGVGENYLKAFERR